MTMVSAGPGFKYSLGGILMKRFQTLKKTAAGIFRAGISAVDPDICVRQSLVLVNNMLHIKAHSFCLDDIRRIYLIGAGKASAAMVQTGEGILGDLIHDGLVITKYDHGVPLNRCRLMEAGHPLPDDNGCRATDELLSLVSRAGPRDLILFMISGGGSALTPAPATGIGLADKQETTRRLLSCGATIHEINTIRKHLSRIKGGQLCKIAQGARVVSLILSDVIGDHLDIIASGMTTADPGTFEECRNILTRHQLWDTVPPSVRHHIEAGIMGKIPETPKPGDALFDKVHNYIVGSLFDALNAAEKEAVKAGFHPMVLSSMIQGEAGEVAKVLCAVAKEVTLANRPVPRPACVLSGGETTVTLKGRGTGGRNMELALAAAVAMKDMHNVVMLSAGTDGTDGPTDAAGAFAHGTTVTRAGTRGLSAEQFLADNNSYVFFQELGDLFITGPTRTNVMDMQIILIT